MPLSEKLLSKSLFRMPTSWRLEYLKQTNSFSKLSNENIFVLFLIFSCIRCHSTSRKTLNSVKLSSSYLKLDACATKECVSSISSEKAFLLWEVSVAELALMRINWRSGCKGLWIFGRRERVTYFKSCQFILCRLIPDVTFLV